MTADKITLDRSVVEQALEALDAAMSGGKYPYKHRCSEAINTLREILEQPQVEQEQEPVAWIEHEWSGSGLRQLHFERPAPTVRDEVVRPVWTPLYTHPQPKREPLTDEQIAEIACTPAAVPGSYVHSFARAIDAPTESEVIND